VRADEHYAESERHLVLAETAISDGDKQSTVEFHLAAAGARAQLAMAGAMALVLLAESGDVDPGLVAGWSSALSDDPAEVESTAMVLAAHRLSVMPRDTTCSCGWDGAFEDHPRHVAEHLVRVTAPEPRVTPRSGSFAFAAGPARGLADGTD
jgi:hypothetical protein